jgi:hypothetical protein
VTCFEVTRYSQVSGVTNTSADKRLVADSWCRGNESIIAFQQRHSVISLRYMRVHRSPHPRTGQDDKEFKRTVRCNSRVKVEFKGRSSSSSVEASLSWTRKKSPSSCPQRNGCVLSVPIKSCRRNYSM